MTDCIALVLAGGSGSRFQGDLPKQYCTLAGRGILARAAEALAVHPRIDAVRAVIREEDRPLYDDQLAELDLLPPVSGGPLRQDSARLGLESLAADPPRLVLIHDGARPFIVPGLIDRTLDALEEVPAAVPALPVIDTLKRSDDDGEKIAATVDRSGLWRAQTPQGFRFQDILAAHRAAAGSQLTDDAAVAEHAGMAVAIVAGDEDNIKITTRSDMARGERMIAATLGVMRIGQGFDVHRIGPGDHVMLCGLRIDCEFGLIGHSDADVGLHALTDAVLGAIADGDIGRHFPPSDPAWRNAPSDTFLRDAAARVSRRGGAIIHLDLTLICERPRIAAHRDAMRARIAEIAGIDPSGVSVKATTTEGLGFTGRGEGIAAQAVATVRLPVA